MTVGFHSPFPPARTGVAAYAEALAGELRRRGEVKLNRSSADVCLYHLGNNPLHREVYRKALDRPGVIVLHDAVLHHFLLGTLDEEEYIEEFVHNYGGWHRGLAEELWRGRARSAQDPRYFRRPMLKRAAERSRAVIVHNPGAANMVRAHAPDARVYEIPHLLLPPSAPPPAREALRLREKLGLAPRTFVYGLFGHLRESKRVFTVLRAFERVRRERGSSVALLAAGEAASADLARAIAPLLAAPGIVRLGHTPESEFHALIHAADACLNLRWPSAGETSGIAIRAMAAGKPVILTNSAENSRFPETGCLRVDPGVAELDMLCHYMLWLAARPADAAAIGSRAAAHVRAGHEIGKVGDSYWKVLCAHRD